MTTNNKSDLDSAKAGIAMLATCIVQTINESDPTFRDRFLERLARANYELQNNTDGDVKQQMEVLGWTRTFLTGFSFTEGQEEPFLSNYTPSQT